MRLKFSCKFAETSESLQKLSTDERCSANRVSVKIRFYCTHMSVSGPILALAIRGTFARSLWIEAVGPSDPVLARRTDPGSLIAQFGGESR